MENESFNKEVEMMREKINECVQGRKEADCKEPHNPECDGQDCGAISQIKSLPTLSLDLHS